MTQRLVGLDIGTNAVRVVELAVDGSRREMVRFAQVALPSGAVIDGEVEDPPAVSDAIRRLWELGDVASKDVVVGINGQRVFVRQTELDVADEQELKTALTFEAQNLVPIAVDDAILDYVVIDKLFKEGEEPRMRVMLAAAPRTVVERHLQAVIGAGLRPIAVDVVSLALVRVVAGGLKPQDWIAGAEAIISVGSDATNVVIHENGMMRFSRTINIGGQHITTAISDAFGISFAQAEMLKRRADQSSSNIADREVFGLLPEAISELTAEISSSVDYYSTLGDSAAVARVVLTGGGSITPFLAARLQRRIGAEVVLFDPFTKVNPSNTLKLNDRDAMRVMQLSSVGIGLALGAEEGNDNEGISLLPTGVAVRHREKRHLVTLGAAMSLLAAFLMGMWAYKGVQLSSEHNREDKAKSAMTKAQAATAQYASVQQLFVATQKQESIIESALTGDVSYAQLLQQISAALPKGVYLKGLSIRRGTGGKSSTISMTALGNNPSSPGETQVALASLPVFSEVWVGSSATDSASGSGSVRFDLTCKITSVAKSNRSESVIDGESR